MQSPLIVVQKYLKAFPFAQHGEAANSDERRGGEDHSPEEVCPPTFTFSLQLMCSSLTFWSSAIMWPSLKVIFYC